MSETRKVLFFDDFDGDRLDLSRWNTDNTPAEDSSAKRYTDRPENLRVENSRLILTARREDYLGGKYTSATVNTQGKFSFCYGRLEMRACLPFGEGLWPAFWTLGDAYTARGDEDGWPYGGEIDVMEFLGIGDAFERNNTMGRDAEGCEVYKDGLIGNNRSTCNLHWGCDRAHHASSGGEYCLPAGIFADDYHVFAAEWTAETITFYVDDKQVHQVSVQDPAMMEAFHKPHWLIINLGLVEGWGPAVSDKTPFPQSYFVDWVRVLAPA